MTNILWTSSDIENLLGIKLEPWKATGISIDSRTLQRGDIFFAIQGENSDGHYYVDEAFRRGAAAAFVERPVTNSLTEIQVTNTVQVVRMLARLARERMKGEVIGITGSVGKTSIKECLRNLLSKQGLTSATSGNFNNLLGLPISLARMHKDTKYGVFELGMNHPGEMRELSKILQPQVAAISSIELAHKQFFENIEAIADAKAEIFEHTVEGGTAIIPSDIPQYQQLLDAAKNKGLNVVSFGISNSSNVKLLKREVIGTGWCIHANIAGEIVEYDLTVPGDHWITNSLCVLACIQAIGANVHQAAHDITSYTLPKGRGQQHVLHLENGTAILLDDSYNASPASVRAGLSILGSTPAKRRIAILGDMLELGVESVRYHEELKEHIESNHVDLMLAVGPLMLQLYKLLPTEKQGGHVMRSFELLNELQTLVRPGDVILIKGSAGTKMSLVIDFLIRQFGEPYIEERNIAG